MGGWKPDWTPMIPRKSIEDWSWEHAEDNLVNLFPHSKTRKKIWQALITFRSELLACGCRSEILLDGSFLTYKWNPEDADVVLVVKEAPNSSEGMNLLTSAKNRKIDLLDSYLVIGIDPQIEQISVDRWLNWFGKDRIGMEKGMVRLTP